LIGFGLSDETDIAVGAVREPPLRCRRRTSFLGLQRRTSFLGLHRDEQPISARCTRCPQWSAQTTLNAETA